MTEKRSMFYWDLHLQRQQDSYQSLSSWAFCFWLSFLFLPLVDVADSATQTALHYQYWDLFRSIRTTVIFSQIHLQLLTDSDKVATDSGVGLDHWKSWTNRGHICFQTLFIPSYLNSLLHTMPQLPCMFWIAMQILYDFQKSRSVDPSTASVAAAA